MQVPGSPCPAPAPAPAPATAVVPLHVGGARAELCPGGQGLKLGPVPWRLWGQQCHSPDSTHHCCWCLGITAGRSLLPPSVLSPDTGLPWGWHCHPHPWDWCHCLTWAQPTCLTLSPVAVPGCLTLAVNAQAGLGCPQGLAVNPCLCPTPSLDYPGVCQPGLGPLLGPGEEGREELTWPWVSCPVVAPSPGVTR